MPSAQPPPPGSEALAANLAETRREVEVPSDFAPLVATVEELYGVRSAAEKLLTEYFHPLRNRREVAAQLGRLSGTMFHYYERGPDRVRCAALLNDLFAGMYDNGADDGVIRTLVGAHLQLLLALGASEHREAYQPVMESAVSALQGAFPASVCAFLAQSSFMRRVGQRLEPGLDVTDAFAALYTRVLDRAHDLFKHHLGAGSGAAGLPSAVTGPLRRLLRLAERHGPNHGELYALPNLDDLLNETLRLGAALPSPLDRIALAVHLAGIAELEHRNVEILNLLSAALREVCEEGGDDEVHLTVDLVCDRMGLTPPPHRHILYTCLEKLGEQVALRRSKALTEHFIDRVIGAGFERPDIRGVSEEWEIWVNPNHLRCLRAWLAIIRSDPVLFERLLSALVINLFVHGVFIHDTDLFQRDVSALLNTNITRGFHLIMQLVHLFPVFFNQLGSEGELREVSTRIDQLSSRADPLVHFLRKQSHAESNNRLVDFARGVYGYWRTGDTDPLTPHLPTTLRSSLTIDSPWFTGVHRAAGHLAEVHGVEEETLSELDLDQLQEWVEAIPDVEPSDRERVVLLVRMFRLLEAKYAYPPEGVLSLIERSNLVEPALHHELAEACTAGDPLRVVRAGNRVLEALKRIITDDGPTAAFENIYHKRHIAAGIPSMYGTYHEPRFDALGLLIRLTRLLKTHLESLVGGFNFRYITRAGIHEAYGIMREMLAGLKVVGLRVDNLSTQVELLKRGLEGKGLSAEQYLNIVDFISEALADVIETSYLALHERNLATVAAQLSRGRAADAERSERVSEEFLRSVIASTYAIQELDLFLNRLRTSLRSMIDALTGRACDTILAYTPDRLLSFVQEPLRPREDQLSLGYKGLAIKRLVALGLRVPPALVVSTELFTLLPALRYPDLREDTRERILAAVARLEQDSGRRLGDPARPLLLSVRSGASFSMPGMMDTILNVGLNRALAEELAVDEEHAWWAWDCYRRYLQNVAMSHGMSRDLFDRTMVSFKERYSVERKVEFSAPQMREMALEYERVARAGGAALRKDPHDQVMQAVFLVLGSWESHAARLYRSQLRLSDDWGTGVIIQQMVFGNLHTSSGSGVVFTRDPRSPSSRIGLYGDFTVCSQGEDVVAGLVHPLPVSEEQRQKYAPHVQSSLELAFPAVYSRLREIAEQLINEHGFEHQEIEFTFESPDAADLNLLQTRPLRFATPSRGAVFAEPAGMQSALVAQGIGVSGGALSGVVALEAGDIARLRTESPGTPVILLRPDTVPEDISLVVAVDGVLTARGGFTSHAAITAKRLGKCCVVGCRALVITEGGPTASLAGRTLTVGDPISLDGASGSVFLGAHATTTSPITAPPGRKERA